MNKYCPKCGMELVNRGLYCANCGAKQEGEKEILETIRQATVSFCNKVIFAMTDLKKRMKRVLYAFREKEEKIGEESLVIKSPDKKNTSILITMFIFVLVICVVKILVDDEQISKQNSITYEYNEGDIRADVWYAMDENRIFQLQNAIIYQATALSNGTEFVVTYYPVCKGCHESGEMELTGVSIEEPVSRKYYCSECKINTFARFRIQY